MKRIIQEVIMMRIGRRAREKTVSFVISMPESDYEFFKPLWYGKNRSEIVLKLMKKGVQVDEEFKVLLDSTSGISDN